MDRNDKKYRSSNNDYNEGGFYFSDFHFVGGFDTCFHCLFQRNPTYHCNAVKIASNRSLEQSYWHYFMPQHFVYIRYNTGIKCKRRSVAISYNTNESSISYGQLRDTTRRRVLRS